MINKKILTGIFAAIGASLCCITPVLAVLAGSTGMASSFSWMEPFRPYLILLTIVVLAYAWWDKLKTKKTDIDCACAPEDEAKISFWYSSTFLALITLFSIVMLSFPYWGDTLIKKEEQQATVTLQKEYKSKIAIHVEGMTCASCEVSVESVTGDVPGVTFVKASTAKKEAIVEFDKRETDVDKIIHAISSTGYTAVGYKELEQKDSP